MAYKDPEKKKAHSREYYLKNRERISAQQKEYYTRSYAENPEAWKSRERKSYAKHRNKRLAYHRKWNASHPESLRKAGKKWRMAHPEQYREMKRRSRLAAEYGITLERFNEMIAEQDGLCAICQLPKKLVIDHNHKTGFVRKLLCETCNFGLGHFQENVELLERAKIYLLQEVAETSALLGATTGLVQ